MKWAAALRTEPPHPVSTLVSRQQKYSQTPAVSPPREGNTCLLSDISVHYHLKGALCVPALSCTGWLIIHVICVPLAASPQRCVWGDTLSQHAGPLQASDWVGGWTPANKEEKRRDSRTEFSVRQPPTPTHIRTPATLEGVAWLIPRHILSGKSSSDLGSGLG